MLKDDWESAVDDPGYGRSSTLIYDQDIDKIRNLLLGDRRLTIRYIIEQIPISVGPFKKF